METSARLFKLCIFVVLSLCYWKWLVPLVWVIIICTLYYVRGVVWWVATSLRTNHTQHLLIFYLSNWRTRLFADNSSAASDFINGFFLRFLLALTFWGLLAHFLGSLDTWGWIVQQYLQTTQWWKSPRAEPYNTTHETSDITSISLYS